MWSFFLHKGSLLLLKNKILSSWDTAMSLCSMAKRLSTQTGSSAETASQYDLDSSYFCTFAKVLAELSQPRQTSHRDTLRDCTTSPQKSSTLGLTAQASFSRGCLCQYSCWAKFWNTALGRSWTGLSLYILCTTRSCHWCRRSGVCMSDLQNFFRKSNLCWTAEKLLVGRSVRFSFRTAAATVKSTTLLRSYKKTAETSLYVVSWKIQQCVWNFFKVYPQKNKHCGHY